MISVFFYPAQESNFKTTIIIMVSIFFYPAQERNFKTTILMIPFSIFYYLRVSTKVFYKKKKKSYAL